MVKKAYIKEAAEGLGLTSYQLRRLAKENRVPFIKSGVRYIFDIDLCHEHLRNEAMANAKPIDGESNKYGTLRRVNEN
jgi:excisionase family DNA binding protein